MSVWLSETPNGVRLSLYVAPRAARSRVAGEYGDRLKLHVAAPPVDGAANKEIVRYLSRLTGVAKSNIRITSGDTGKRKSVEIEGMSLHSASEVFNA